MTKNDYQDIAEHIRALPKNRRNEIALHFAARFAYRNMRFNRSRFLEACGYVEGDDE